MSYFSMENSLYFAQCWCPKFDEYKVHDVLHKLGSDKNNYV